MPATSFQNARAAVVHNFGTVTNNFGGEESRPETPESTALAVRDGQFVPRDSAVEAIERAFGTGSRVALVGPAGSG